MTKPVEVTQADREAARIDHRRYSKPDTELQLALEQGFARHRHEATRELVGDKKRLDWLIAECADIRWISDGSDEVGIQIIKHHMAEPQERVVSEDWNENLRGCIDRAMTAKHTGGGNP